VLSLNPESALIRNFFPEVILVVGVIGDKNCVFVLYSDTFSENSNEMADSKKDVDCEVGVLLTRFGRCVSLGPPSGDFTLAHPRLAMNRQMIRI
jgi:hypothetical protein